MHGLWQRRVPVPGNDRSAPHGRYQDAAPLEAVDPRTVSPGIHGKLTDRARGRRTGPLAQQQSSPELGKPQEGIPF